MNRYYSIIVAFILMFSFMGASAQNATMKISRQQSLEDIESLLFIINEVYPNMYFQRKEQNVHKDVTRIKKNLPDSIDRVDYFKVLCP